MPVNDETAKALRALNTRFYEEANASFGQTRHNRWPGWERVLEVAGCPRSVGDFACGNLRFEAFLEHAYPTTSFDFAAVDVTPFPAWEEVCTPVRFMQADLLDTPDLGLDPMDLVVSFGFMHHIPGQKAREDYVRWLMAQTRPGGHVAVSFWRYLDEPSLAAKIVSAPDGLTGLDPGDAFLGWQGSAELVRYCHSFSDADIDELVKSLEPDAQVVARYRADGRNDALNEYVIWRI